MLEELQKKNPDFELIHVQDERFLEYGTILTGIDCTELLSKLEERDIPTVGNIYVGSDPELENLPVAKNIQEQVFGDLPIQIGYCNGNNDLLNALEYHKFPEVIVGTTDIVLFLGNTVKIKENSYSVEEVQAFFVPKETVVELYGTTMHFAPCKTSNDGFKTIVILPRGTNEDFEEAQAKDSQTKTLFKRGKWILVHPENEVLIQRGGYPGLKGKNLQLKY